MRRFSRLLVFVLVAASTVVLAQPPVNVDTLGPQPGTTVPSFTAVDQAGRTQTLASLAGSKGTMLVFSRSADW